MRARQRPEAYQYSGNISSIAAPLGGWNTRDPLATMPATDALQMENVYTDNGEVENRGGSTLWVGPAIAQIHLSLLAYNAPASVGNLFTASVTGIYNVTVAGVFGAPSYVWPFASIFGNANGINFTNSAGAAFLWVADGVNPPVTWNGAVWAATVITGIVAPATLKNPWQHSQRIFAVESNTMNVWYLGVYAIQGAATVFPMGALFKHGGAVHAGTSWSLDSGAGPDDYWAVITTQGEVAVYRGTNPNSASSWGIIGVYYIGKPLGNRCFSKLGGDVVVLTEGGIFNLSQALATASVSFKQALTDKIRPTFQEVARTSTVTTNWQVLTYPIRSALIVSIPFVGQGQLGAQFVYNLTTKAWHLFTGWNATAFAVWNGKLYYTDGSQVYNAWTLGTSDITVSGGAVQQDIISTIQTSYNYFRKGVGLAQIELMRFLLRFNAAFELRWGVSVDYNTLEPVNVFPRSTLGTNFGRWDISLWDVDLWEALPQRFSSWVAARNAPGYAASLTLQWRTTTARIQWAGTDVFKRKGALL